jgi:proline iminopeptidase
MTRSLRGAVAALGAAACMLAGCASHRTAPILDERGQARAGSIATLEPIELGGVTQWILIRGRDVGKPLLLKIHGGPGQAEMATAPLNAGLEADFVVVEWDQRGAGKSAAAGEPAASMKVDRFVDDTIELSEQLLRRFDRGSLILVGHSWGGAVGLLAVQRRPQLYRAFVATGPMVNYSAAMRAGHAALMQEAEQRGDAETTSLLRELGPPPYTGADGAGRRERYLGALERSGHLWHGPGRFDRVGWMLSAPEYAWLEKLRFAHAAERSFDLLMTELLQLDLAQRALAIDVPVYFAIGRYDAMSPPSVAAEYFAALTAPRKQWVWFEHSAHFPQWEEPQAFHALLTERVVPETAAR